MIQTKLRYHITLYVRCEQVMVVTQIQSLFILHIEDRQTDRVSGGRTTNINTEIET